MPKAKKKESRVLRALRMSKQHIDPQERYSCQRLCFFFPETSLVGYSNASIESTKYHDAELCVTTESLQIDVVDLRHDHIFWRQQLLLYQSFVGKERRPEIRQTEKKSDLHDTNAGSNRPLRSRIGTGGDVWLTQFHGVTNKFVSNTPIFNVTLNGFSQGFTTLYDSETELEQDLTANMLFFADSIISGRQADNPTFAPVHVDYILPKQVVTEVTDCNANNQEEGVDKADIVKSNDKHVYAAYDNFIEVWEADTGRRTARVDHRRTVEGLLLTGTKLTVMANGGSKVYKGELFPSTNVTVFRTTTDGGLIKERDRFVIGSFRDARSIGDNVHLVSTFEFRLAPVRNGLSRENEDFEGLDATAYVQRARQKAEEEEVPRFVERIIAAISSQQQGSMPRTARSGMWQTGVSENVNVEKKNLRGKASNH